MGIHIYDRALQFIIDSDNENHYRLGTKDINGETIVKFSSDLLNTSYYITILSYTSNNRKIEYGWTIDENSKSIEGFTFTPPSRYSEGVLTYEVKYYK